MRRLVRIIGTVLLFCVFLLSSSGKAFSQNDVKISGYVIDVKGKEPSVPPEFEPSIKSRYKKWIVQFTGPIHEEDKKQLVNFGCRIGDYLPEFAFIVTMDDKTKKQVEALPFINGIVRYKSAYKIAGRLKNDAGAVIAENGKNIKLHIRMDGANNLSLVLSEVHKKKGRVLNVSGDIVRVEIDQADIVRLAQIEEVLWIEEAVDLKVLNDTTKWTIQTYVPNDTKIWDKGVHGEGQIVGIGDTGLDYDMPWFRDPAGTAIGPAHRKIVGYDTTYGDDYDADEPGHGTHVAGIAGGDRTPVDGLSSANGMAPKSRFFIQDLTPGSSNYVYPPSDLGELFIKAYEAGARIHTNSWGNADNSYSTYAQSGDRFLWEHKDFLALFANGNSGPGLYTVGNPATAKNVISVGATLNGSGAESVTWFSSHGPTSDGRLKPTVTAPGDGVTDGAGIISADSDGIKNSFNSGTRSMRGTSMATPAVAGAAALVRQYFADGYYPTGAPKTQNGFTPTAALIKATLINSAQNMAGSYADGSIPSKGQGWGRINLANSLMFSGDVKNLEIADNTAGLTTGQSWSQRFYAPTGQSLKVTLVWTDYPGASAATKAIVNDLDLSVTAPGETTTYLGNVFSGGESVTGGEADRLNVEEQVLIMAPVEGFYTVTVTGYNVPNGPQPFALVVTGASSVTQKGVISLNKGAYTTGATAEIRVADRGLDLSSSVDEVFVTIRSGTEPGGETVRLTETGPNTAVFTGSIPLSSQPPVPNNGMLEVTDGDTVTAVYADADNGTGTPATVIATAVIDATPPVISSVTASSLDEVGATVTWTTNEPASSVMNYGETVDRGIVKSDSRLVTQHSMSLTNLNEGGTYYYTVSSIDDAGNLATSDNAGSLYTFTTAKLPPSVSAYSAMGSETFLDYTILYGLATDPSGVGSVLVNGQPAAYRVNDGYYEFSLLLAMGVNPVSVIATDSLGNARNISLNITRVQPPDLVMTAVAGPASGLTGGNITITDSVGNSGSGDSRGFSVGFYLSSDSTITTSDTYLGSRYVASLAAGGSSGGITTVSLPTSLAPGTYYIGAIADYNNVQYESDETNNSMSGNQIVIEGPDLAMTAVAGPSEGVNNGTITITNTVTNNGPAPASSVYITFYLSTDSVITTSDTNLGYRVINSLPGAASSTADTVVTIPGNLAGGTYTIGAIADPYNSIKEPDENNNSLAGNQISIANPDLSVTAVYGPESGITGGAMTVSTTVTASASGGGVGAFTVGIYLSADPAITTQDTRIGTRFVNGLAPGASSAADTAVTIPSALAGGTYYIGAIADDANVIREADENNNSRTGNLITVIGPDLTMAAVNGPAIGNNGGTITVSTTVANDIAGGGADGFYVGIYLSADSMITNSDYYIGSRYVSSLAPGASSVGDTLCNIPGNLPPGTYFIGAIADTNNSIKESDKSNNALAGSQITVNNPDLTVTAVSGPSSGITAGTITVTNTVAASAAGGAAGGFYVGIYLSPDNVISKSDTRLGERFVGSLMPGASSTADTVVTIPSSLSGGTYYIGVIADDNNAIRETDETNNALAGNQIIVTGPDLLLTEVSGPGNGYKGGAITVRTTVAAAAGGGGANAFSVGIYLSADEVITASDTFLGSRSVSGLMAGASSTADTTVTIPTGLSDTVYYIGAIADNGRAVKETDESNNAMTGNRIVLANPDLRVTAVSGPTGAMTGGKITVANTAVNNGPGTSVGFSVGIYLSTDNVITTADTLVGYRFVSGLAPGASSAADTVVTIPTSIEGGSYYIGAIADYSNSVIESDETNNALAGNQITVTGPDLTMTAAKGPESSITGGTITIGNAAGASAGGGSSPGFWVGIYLSSDSVITAADTRIGERYVGGLAPGATNAANTTVTIPRYLASGLYYIGAIADYSNSVTESDETNNAIVGNQITISGPDLYMTAVSGPARGSNGGAITVSNTVAAAATGGSADGFSVGIYLSTDSVITTSDTRIGERYVGGLSPGTTSAADTPVTIPANIAPGTYYIGAIADYSNYITNESDETNNSLAGNQIEVKRPDLFVTAVSGPASTITGGTITIGNTVTAAAAGGDAPSFSVGIYLSADNVITTSDIYLGSRSLSNLAAGASSVADTLVTIPTSIAGGTYYIGVIADYSNYVTESDETNNALAGNQITVIGPDLSMAAVNGPASSFNGGTITVSNTVAAAAGGGRGGGFYVGIYLSTDNVITTADTLIGTRSVNSLAPGASSAADTVVTIPAAIAGGTYYIGAIADYANYVTESDETNNALTGNQIVLVNPDLKMTSVIAPTSGLTSGTITVTNTVSASADAGGTGGFSVGIYFSADNVITTGDTLIGYRYVSGLASGTSNTADTVVSLPDNITGGTYYIGAIADYDNRVTESNETNNALAGNPITVTGPDLTMTAVKGPATGYSGGSLTVSNTVAASGGGTGGFFVGIYLSPDNVITTSDTNIGYRYVSGLAPGGSSSENTAVFLPTSVVPGTYYIGAIADHWGYVPETNENNNSLAGNKITVIGPDLMMSEVGGPAIGPTNGTITVRNTVIASASGTSAEGFSVGIYLSTDPVISPSDISLGGRYVSELAPGASSTEDTVVTIPGDIAGGTYYIGAIADSFNYVTESDETNNALAGNQMKVVNPDLTMTAVSGPTAGSFGQYVTVTNTVSTSADGGYPSGFSVGIYLSTDNVITTNDIYLGSRYVYGLLPGASSTEATSVYLPTSLKRGTYYIGAIADYTNNVKESNETNNALTGNQIFVKR
jgi:subtilase family serine protease